MPLFTSRPNPRTLPITLHIARQQGQYLLISLQLSLPTTDARATGHPPAGEKSHLIGQPLQKITQVPSTGNINLPHVPNGPTSPHTHQRAVKIRPECQCHCAAPKMTTCRIIRVSLDEIRPAGRPIAVVVGSRLHCAGEQAHCVLRDGGDASNCVGTVGRRRVRRDVVSIQDEAGGEEGDTEGQGERVEVGIAVGLTFFGVRGEDHAKVIVVSF